MRFFYLIVLLALLAAVGIFAVQNEDSVSIKYLDQTIAYPLALVVGVAYLLGMVSGWTVVGIFKRSFQWVTERRER
jgi:uncharacterized integral membrane protein